MLQVSAIQSGRGKGRNPFKIRSFLIENGLNMSSIARMAGTTPGVVSLTVRGTGNNKKVLELLEELGCPTTYLYGAADMPNS